MYLMIVESPTKAKKIEKILAKIRGGEEWVVKASVGHIRDLPVSPSVGIGVDYNNNFKPEYEIVKPDVVAMLRKFVRLSDKVILAMDLDREGEGIAWHLAEVLKLSKRDRVTFSEITGSAIGDALDNAKPLNMNLVAAQEARRVLDRMIGYIVSPVLGEGRSAGRVQSPALWIIVDREREIENFKSVDHYGVTALLASGEGEKAEWVFGDLLPKDVEQKIWLDDIIPKRVAATKSLTVVKSEKKRKERKPPEPFTTSVLQQVASSRMGISLEQTMRAAQKLFEDGVITYHRTDSPVLSPEAEIMVREYLKANGFSIPDEPNKWKAKKGAQEAHEGIRVTDIALENHGSGEQGKIYDLIRNRTLACQSSAMVYDETLVSFSSDDVDIEGEPALFVGRGQQIVMQGWQAIERPDSDDVMKKGLLTLFVQGQSVACECKLNSKKTSPLPRYSEGTLVKRLEKEQIGRPSTYASILNVLKKRNYVVLEKGKLKPTGEGVCVVDMLVEAKFRFIRLGYTKEVEKGLDLIARGEHTYLKLVSNVCGGLNEDIKNIPPGSQVKKMQVEPLDGDGGECPDCGEQLITKRAGKGLGRFLSCSAYPKCSYSVWPKKIVKPLDGEGGECPKCKKLLITKEVHKGKHKGKRFLSCAGWLADNSGCDYVDWGK